MQILVKSNYLEIHQPLLGNPLAPIGKLPTIGKLTIEAKEFSGLMDFQVVGISPIFALASIVLYL